MVLLYQLQCNGLFGSFKTVQLFSGFFSIKVCPNSCENGYVMQILKMDIQEQNEEFE